MIGESLGPYKILEPLGAGGMGEVYLAEDSRLGRKVAIKVLPAEFASDPERLARFGQEARAAAALNHPHIAVVHDIGFEPAAGGDSDGTAGQTGAAGTVGTHYMVQEYLRGQSLGERLDEGALPLEKALALAIEVGEALIAAHRAGIIHRDLKPGNIFVTEEGHAKVLDFGLAKLTEMAAPAGSQASMSPTMLGTVAGQVMGTAGYMAPEQVNGEEVDHRVDLFAFGCVLYGMVTGRQAFAGRNVMQTLDLILAEDPQPIGEIKPDLPLKLQWILEKALAKEPAKRYQAAADLVVDLRTLGADVESGTAMPVSGEAPTTSVVVGTARGIPWKLTFPIAVATLVIGVLGTWLAIRPTPPAPQPPVRLDLIVEDDIADTLGSSVVLSPDGERIAYVVGAFGGTLERELMIRSLDQQDSTGLVARATNDFAPYHPFFSTDGQWVGFVTPTELRKVPVTGGTPLPIAEVDRSRGADWGPDETIVFTPNRTSGLFLVSANGGEPEPLTELAEGERTHRWPQFLPGGKAVLFTSHVAGRNFDAATIEVVDLGTRERKVVYRGGNYGRYVPTGHLVYANAGTLFAIPFDLDALEATGSATPVVEDVVTNAEGGAQFSFSEAGMLAYVRGTGADGDPEFTLSWVDREGNTEPLPFESRGYAGPRLSPEENRIAVEIRERGERHIWILDIATGTSQRLTFEGNNSSPVWSPDGEWVYFRSDRGGDFDIFRKPVDLSAEAERLYEAESAQYPASISADGTVLMFFEVAGAPDIGMISLDGDSEPRMLVATAAATAQPSISPDGRWFAFQSDETGSGQIHVQDIETQSRRIISTGGGDNTNAVWSRDGTEIFYRSGPGQLSVVEVTREPELSFSAPRLLFEVAGLQRAFDVTADRQRFLGTTRAASAETTGEPTTPRISVVLNWFEELKQRVPGGR
ncbi:MAG: protein kinase [Acidobacteriota bacterium]